MLGAWVHWDDSALGVSVNLKLLRGRVLIRPTVYCDEVQSRLTSIGLIVPDTLVDDPRHEDGRRKGTLGRGIVVDIGPPARSKKGKEMPPAFAVGDEVLHIGQHESRWTTVDGEKLRVCSQEEVCAVIE